MKRVFDSIHEVEQYFNQSVGRDYSEDALYVCYHVDTLSYIFHEHKDLEEDSIEEALEFDDEKGYEADYVYVKVNHHLHHEIERKKFESSILGCEFVRSNFETPYRQFVHNFGTIDGEFAIADQENRWQLFRTCKFYIDDETLVSSYEFTKFIKGE